MRRHGKLATVLCSAVPISVVCILSYYSLYPNFNTIGDPPQYKRQIVEETTLQVAKGNFRRFITDFVEYDDTKKSKRYIIYICDGNKTHQCGGLGDRINGIVSTFLLSILTHRKFRIEHTNPFDLNLFYQLDHIKADSLLLKKIESKEYNFLNSCQFKNSLPTLYLESLFQEDVIYLRINWNIIPDIRLRTDIDSIPHLNLLTDADIYQEIIHLILNPRQQIKDEIMKIHQTVVKGRRIVCAHFRKGRNPTMPRDVKVSRIDMKILWKWMDRYDQPENVLFIGTDSNDIQKKAKLKYANNLIEIPGQIVHIDQPTKTNKTQDGFRKTIIEHEFLSTCDVLLLTKSGFGFTAAYRRNSSANLFCLPENSHISPCQPYTMRHIITGVDFSIFCNRMGKLKIGNVNKNATTSKHKG